jgi:hypothetical protein
MERTRIIRWLRISASAVCLVVCGLMIALWVRSYWAWDGVRMTLIGVPGDFQCYSCRGRVELDFFKTTRRARYTSWSGIHGKPPDELYWELKDFGSVLGFKFRDFSNPVNGRIAKGAIVPHWSLILLSATLAAVPWLPWWSTRFSLRTMLIVTTLVAVVLGLGVWLTRR